jgi:16S rRNA (guanine966-N2)-methyltransferase
MRIISGKFKNRNMKAGGNFRPTTDRVRETLFNIIQNDVSGSIFVDAFAGSGAVGIEALSRGAAMVYFIESNIRTLKILESNLANCGEGLNWRIYSLPVTKGLEVLAASGEHPDIVFFDPPYEFDQYTELLTVAANLFPSAMLIVESSSRIKITLPPGVHVIKERKTGEKLLSFLAHDSQKQSNQG